MSSSEEEDDRLIGQRKRGRGKESDIYGVFLDDEDYDARGPDRGRRGGASTSSRYTRPVGFVSGGAKVDSEEEGEDDDEGGHQGAGLGFGGGGLGFGAEPKEDASEPRGGLGSFGVPTSFGQSILKAADKRRNEAKTAKASTSSGGAGDDPTISKIGAFERHTKGIGLKLLQKMGYQLGKGLGKGNRGIAAPVEAQLRPKGMALGFGEPQEKPKPAKPAEKPKAPPKPANLWQKSKKVAREKVKYRTAEELLEAEDGPESVGKRPAQTIIDMRGPQSKVLSKMDNINEVSMDALAETTPMPELQYNMRLVVDLAESKLRQVDHEIAQEREIVATYRDKLARMESSRGERGTTLRRLREVSDFVSAIAGKKSQVQTLERAGDVLGQFQELKQRYPGEFAAYRVGTIATSIVYGVLESNARAWKPLEECAALKEVFERSRSVLQGEATDGSADPYALLVRETVCFQLHRYIRHGWNPLDPDAVVHFLDQWGKVFPPQIRDHILSQMVLPRLRDAVDDWKATRETAPVHVWIHPWLPYLSDQLKEIYPLIRQKIAQSLKTWEPSDGYALSVLKPWKPVFDLKSWDKFTCTTVIPKLEAALSELAIDWKSRDTQRVKWVCDWSDCISSRILCGLLSKAFFPKLHSALFQWLSRSPDFDQVVDWYEEWKGVFPEELEAQGEIRDQFNKCLVMMNAAVSGEDLSSFDPSKGGRGAGDSGAAGADVGAPKAPQDFEASLKDLVESFGIEAGVDFFPKVGRFNKSLQIYSFGGISITLDNRRQAIEAYLQGKWVGVSLERLRSEAKK